MLLFHFIGACSHPSRDMLAGANVQREKPPAALEPSYRLGRSPQQSVSCRITLRNCLINMLKMAFKKKKSRACRIIYNLNTVTQIHIKMNDFWLIPMNGKSSFGEKNSRRQYPQKPTRKVLECSYINNWLRQCPKIRGFISSSNSDIS